MGINLIIYVFVILVRMITFYFCEKLVYRISILYALRVALVYLSGASFAVRRTKIRLSIVAGT